MKFPLAPTVQIAKYVAQQQRKGERYPLVLMLEPTLACNIACLGCGQTRDYDTTRARLSDEHCHDAGPPRPSPGGSICARAPPPSPGAAPAASGPLPTATAAQL